MPQTRIDVFDRTIQKSHLWLKELMEDLRTEDQHFAYMALRSALHALRDRLPKEEAMHLASQLPLVIAGVFVDGWRIKDKPEKFDRQEFFDRIREEHRFSQNQVDPQRIARAVFRLLARHVSPGEIKDVVDSFPADLKDLWSPEEGEETVEHKAEAENQARQRAPKSAKKAKKEASGEEEQKQFKIA